MIKNLELVVGNILNKLDVLCGPEDLEDCLRTKGDCTMVKFSCQRKSSEVLRKKKKLKNIDGSEYDFNAGIKLYTNESLCPYYLELWEGNVRGSG